MSFNSNIHHFTKNTWRFLQTVTLFSPLKRYLNLSKTILRRFSVPWYYIGDIIKTSWRHLLFSDSIKFMLILVYRCTKFYLQRISSQENRGGEFEWASQVLQSSQIVLPILGFLTASMLRCADSLFSKYYGRYCYFHS